MDSGMPQPQAVPDLSPDSRKLLGVEPDFAWPRGMAFLVAGFVAESWDGIASCPDLLRDQSRSPPLDGGLCQCVTGRVGRLAPRKRPPTLNSILSYKRQGAEQTGAGLLACHRVRPVYFRKVKNEAVVLFRKRQKLLAESPTKEVSWVSLPQE
jgi:hypothetical protein